MIRLPTACFAEDEGSLTNSGCWMHWQSADADPPVQAKSDAWIMAQIHLRMRALYQKGGGKLWTGCGVPDMVPTANPETVMPFIMQQ